MLAVFQSNCKTFSPSDFLVFDVCGYKDKKIMETLYLKNFTEEKMAETMETMPHVTVRRYVFPLNINKQASYLDITHLIQNMKRVNSRYQKKRPNGKNSFLEKVTPCYIKFHWGFFNHHYLFLHCFLSFFFFAWFLFVCLFVYLLFFLFAVWYLCKSFNFTIWTFLLLVMLKLTINLNSVVPVQI